MKIIDVVPITGTDANNCHVVEIGFVPNSDSSEDGGMLVLRSVYKVDGKIDPNNTVQIPLHELGLLVEIASDHNLFIEEALDTLKTSISKSIVRRQLRNILEEDDDEEEHVCEDCANAEIADMPLQQKAKTNLH